MPDDNDPTERYSQLAIRVHSPFPFADALDDTTLCDTIEAAGVEIREREVRDPIYEVQERQRELRLNVEVVMGNTTLFDFATNLKQRIDAWLNEGRAEPISWVVEVEAEHVTVTREGLVIQ